VRRAVFGVALVLVGCGGAARSVQRMSEMYQVRGGPAAQEAAQLAPQAFAHADQERELAKKASADGDDLAAQIYADRAIAAYGHAFVLARMARASSELAEANASLAAANEQARQLAASRAEVDREGKELDKKVKVVREALAPAPSGPADTQREAARMVAARALVMQAHLLCGAARLVATGEATGLAEAEKDVTSLEGQLDAARGAAPIDAAARARARCLDALTRVRRGAATGADTDALLGEVSASAGLDPSRDERGVVITLRDAYKGTALAPEAEAKLKELGRVAAAHAGLGVQVVLHDATAPTKADAEGDAQRADAAVKALVGAGAPAAKVKGETAGNRAPVVDPADAAHRARNARLEVVFVSPGN